MLESDANLPKFTNVILRNVSLGLSARDLSLKIDSLKIDSLKMGFSFTHLTFALVYVYQFRMQLGRKWCVLLHEVALWCKTQILIIAYMCYTLPTSFLFL